MSIATQTQSVLVQALQEENGDYLTFDTTTNITTNNSIVSTELKQYDEGEDGFFDGWWVYLNTTNNPSVERRTGLPAAGTTYATATGTLTISGSALSAETAAVTCYLSRYKRTSYVNAVKEAIKVVYPELHKKIDNRTLITGNILPDGHFESWSSASSLNHYSVSSGTLTKTSTAGSTYGGTYSAKYTAGADNDYFYISSDTYPRLLELTGQCVDGYVMAMPETANDASIEIYTIDRAGSTQTLTSSTSNPTGAFTMLELESQNLNDNLEEIQIRFKVATNTKYVIFDDAYICGKQLKEYLVPDVFEDGHISEVIIQRGSQYGSNLAYENMNPFITSAYKYSVQYYTISDSTYRYLRLHENQDNGRRMRLLGYGPLETLSSDTDTITLDSRRVPLLIAYAKYIFWKREVVPISQEDRTLARTQAYDALNEYYRLLPKLRMSIPAELLRK